MVTVTYILRKGQPLTPEQIEEIRALKAEKRPIVYDDEFPELTDEEIKQFRRVNPRRPKQQAAS